MRELRSHMTARLDRAQAEAVESLAREEGITASEALRRLIELGATVRVALSLDEELELRAALEVARAQREATSHR